LRKAMPGLDTDLFASPEARSKNANALAAALEKTFREKKASEWEALLTAVDVACVEVDNGPSQNTLMLPGGLGEKLGIVTNVVHPLFGEHSRLTALMSFSRSTTRAEPGCLIGQHTNAVLREFGYGDETVKDLAAREIILVG
jgi:crotonobetainyl-CoA:carnitine CoA-transferase CaiB-like acyl-CoA transferase